MQARTEHGWTRFLELFLERNRGRPTRLGVFVESGSGFNDYWIEDGMPLNGIAVESVKDRTDVELLLGEAEGNGESRLTHIVRDAGKMKLELGLQAGSDSLEFSGSKGKHTVLRFEDAIT